METHIVEKAILDSGGSMSGAARILGITRYKFESIARKYDLWKPNPAGKGVPKPRTKGFIPLSEILQGQHPQYKTFHLKTRLIAEGIKRNVCECCGLSDVWNGKGINMQLDHINGNPKDHKLDNLRMLCPNCHSQTDTFCGRNKGKS